MQLKAQRRIAAELLNVGKNRVWIDSFREDDVSMALTREDIRKLIDDGVIRARKPLGVSRARARILHRQRRRGQRRGYGKRKGAAKARLPQKTTWMTKIRAQRRYLRGLRETGQITPHQYRELYLKAKGSTFRSVSHLRHTLTESGTLKKPTRKGRRK